MVIIGAGVGGLFTAIELVNKGYPARDILLVDKGPMLSKRKCFVNNETPCKKCKVCSISNGVGGTGSFSDSKLNFDITGRVGGDLYEIFSEYQIACQLKEVYNIYEQFGLNEFKSKEYKPNITINEPGIQLADCLTIHLGTENSRIVYQRMIDYLLSKGVTIKANYEVKELSKEKGRFIINNEITTDKVVLAMGRSGNKLMRYFANKLSLNMKTGRVDIGVRVETLNEYMSYLNENFYEAKLYLKGRFNDTTRVFCTNPGGYVSIESYDNKLYLANGHAYANNKTENTNFALLVSRTFNEDTPNPLEDYMYPLIQAMNSLGKGQVIMQSLKDIKLNRRSTERRIKELDIKPTIKAYAGDITSVMPYRHMIDILEAIELLDKLAPGINGDNTILYAPEAKFHANKIAIDENCMSSMNNLYCIGDSSGWSRGLTTAASMGIIVAKDILNRS